MKKRNLKAIFLGLLGRRRGGDKPPHDQAAAGASQDGGVTRSAIEQPPPHRKAPPVRDEIINATGDDPPRTSPGPPADWLAMHSSGPPPHWVERVRSGAPDLLRNRENDDAGATAAPKPATQVRLRPAAQPRGSEPSRKSPQSPPLRLQRPAQSPRSTQEPERSGRIVDYSPTDGRGRLESGKQERLAPSTSVFLQKDEPDDSGTISQIVSQEFLPLASTQDFAPETRERFAGPGLDAEYPQTPSRPGNTYLHWKIDDESPVAPTEEGGQEFAPPAVSPPADVPFEAESYGGPARSHFGGLIQSSRNGDEYEFPLADPVASGMLDHCGSNDEDEDPINRSSASAARIRHEEFPRWGNREQENTARKDTACYPNVIRRETIGSEAEYDRATFNPGYRRVMKREAEITKPMGPQAARDRCAASYGGAADRWPALFEASPDDYFDDLMTALRELNHTRRLSSEQTGALWKE